MKNKAIGYATVHETQAIEMLQPLNSTTLSTMIDYRWHSLISPACIVQLIATPFR
jgi:hypothetical protein